MSDINSIKNRINSVKSTKKITGAMYLISSAKIQRAKERLSGTRPFFEALKGEVRRIFIQQDDIRSVYFGKKKGKRAFILITADKGLAGAFNKNVLRTFENERKKDKDIVVYVVGEAGIRYLKNRKIDVRKCFKVNSVPSLKQARNICTVILEDYLSGETGELRLLYNDAKSDMVNVVENYRLLPLDRDEFIENGVSGKKSHLDFAQRPEAILANMMPRYITGCLYGALTDSYCAEQNARMAAMKAANDSADDLLSELKINYNRARQGAITQEITEIAAGARAQKLNRKKKKGEEN